MSTTRSKKSRKTAQPKDEEPEVEEEEVQAPALAFGSLADDNDDHDMDNQAPWRTFLTPGEDFATGIDDETREILVAIQAHLEDINGDELSSVAGQPRTYIDAKAFKVIVETEEHNGGIMHPKQAELLEMALDADALGGGVEGFIGAHVRKALRSYYTKSREARIVKVRGQGFTADMKTSVTKFLNLLARHKQLAATFTINAISIAAQSAVNMYSKLHHWDAKNQREWHALMGALGISEEMKELDLRPIVYLAVHPIPLQVLDGFRRAASGVDQSVESLRSSPSILGWQNAEDAKFPSKGFVHSVIIRAKSFPAGTAVMAVASVSLSRLKRESYWPKLLRTIDKSAEADAKVADFETLVRDIKEEGVRYHVMAKEYGAAPKQLDQEKYNEILVVLAAFIKSVEKGTLARSAALRKFTDANQRRVNFWSKMFAEETSAEGVSISEHLDSIEHKTVPAHVLQRRIRGETRTLAAVNSLVSARSEAAKLMAVDVDENALRKVEQMIKDLTSDEVLPDSDEEDGADA